MARRGRFGRQPRVASSLTSTIVSIAREMQSRADSNIMDAWQHGGLYQGHLVTDGEVLKHWQDRLAHVAKDDPLADTYREQVSQLQYAIAESKQAVLYKQGKIGNMQMAQFYLNWEKKAAPNSEFYRTLQKDAAQFVQAAKSAGRGNAAAAKANAYNAFNNDVNDKFLKSGNDIISLFTQIAKDNNIIHGNENLFNFNLGPQSDPAVMENILNVINANPGIYAKAIAGLRRDDPSFNGVLTGAYAAQLFQRMVKGYELLARRSEKDGYATANKAATDGISNITSLAASVKAWPTGAAYSAAQKQYSEVVNNPNSTSADISAALERMSSITGRLSTNTDLTPEMADKLHNESLMYAGDPSARPEETLNDNFLGYGTSNGVGSGQTIIDLATSINLGKQALQANVTGAPPTFISAPAKADPTSSTGFSFDPTGKGQVRVVSMQSVNDAPTDAQFVAVQTSSGAVIMEARPVHDVIVDDPGNPNHGQVVGQQITWSVGTTTFSIYSVTQKGGTKTWTNVNPYVDAVQQVTASDGTVHLTARDNPALKGQIAAATAKAILDQYGKSLEPKAVSDLTAAFADGAPPANATWISNVIDPTSKSKTTIEIRYVDGVVSATRTIGSQNPDGTGGATTKNDLTLNDPATGRATVLDGSPVGAPGLGRVVDSTKLAAGPQNGVDFSSPLMSSLAAAGISASQYSSLSNDPAFQTALIASQYKAAGLQYGSTTPLTPDQQTSLNTVQHADATTVMKLVQPTIDHSFVNPGFGSVPANGRSDLSYPGDNAKMDKATSPSISFGRPINVPNVPNPLLNPPQTPTPQTGYGGFIPSTPKPNTPTPQSGYGGYGAPTVAPINNNVPTPIPTVAPVNSPVAPPVAAGSTSTAPPVGGHQKY